MPTIQLRGDGQDGNRVLARMYYPKDEARYGWLLRGLSELTHSSENDIHGADVSAEAAIRPTSNRDILTLSDTGWRGTLAGEILLGVAAMRTHEIAEPGVRKATFAVQQRGIALMGGDEGVLETTTPFFSMHSVLADAIALNGFLGHAEWLLGIGCEQTSRNWHMGTLLDRSDAWIVMPTPTAIEPNLEAVAGAVAREIQGYRAS